MSEDSKLPRRNTPLDPVDHLVHLPMQVEVVDPVPRTIAITTGITLGSGPDDDISIPGSELAPRQLGIRPGRRGVWVTNLEPQVADLTQTLGDQSAIHREVGLYGEHEVRIGALLLRFSRIRPAPTVHPAFEGFVGRSTVMRAFHRRIEELARNDQPVLIAGGSYLTHVAAAEALHARSRFATGTHAMTSSGHFYGAAWSTFSGNVVGAFPGATWDNPGTVRNTAGGTLHIDGLDSLDDRVCRQVLQLLDEGTVTPLGSTTPVPVEVRLTGIVDPPLYRSKTLGEAQRAVIARFEKQTVTIPPLSERLEDVADLITSFTESDELGLPSLPT